jgi:hypothetical protein
MKSPLAFLLALALPLGAETPSDTLSQKARLAKTPLSSVTFPEVGFDQVSFAEAMDAYQLLFKGATPDQMELQWVYQGVDRETWKPTVTIQGKNLSAAKLLAEILSQTGLEAKLDEHAIVIRPAGGSKTPAAPSKEPAKPAPAPVPAPATNRKPALERGTLDKKSVESSSKDDEHDKKPIKGRNPLKKSD